MRLEQAARCGSLPGMSTVAEIESAIEKLPPDEVRALRDWIVERTEVAKGRMWTPEELGAAAQEMVDEPDPNRANAQWQRIAAGFYGDPGA